MNSSTSWAKTDETSELKQKSFGAGNPKTQCLIILMYSRNHKCMRYQRVKYHSEELRCWHTESEIIPYQLVSVASCHIRIVVSSSLWVVTTSFCSYRAYECCLSHTSRARFVVYRWSAGKIATLEHTMKYLVTPWLSHRFWFSGSVPCTQTRRQNTSSQSRGLGWGVVWGAVDLDPEWRFGIAARKFSKCNVEVCVYLSAFLAS